MMSAEVVNGGGGDLKKKNEEDMVQQQLLPYLDEDIITQILLKIPAQSLFNTLRYVCKSWLNKISTHPDIHLNRLLPSKPPCLIIQNVDKENNLITCFFTLSKEGKVIEQFDDLNPVLGNLWIRACCNGLILATAYSSSPKHIYVVNPLTNHRLIIPHPGDHSLLGTNAELIFIPSTGEYKVIADGFLQGKDFFKILTLSASDCYGSSASNDRLQWRLIEAPRQTLFISPVSINGILYWCDRNIGNNFVSFDASVEKFYENTYGHIDKKASRIRYLGLIEMGGLLSSWFILLEEDGDDVWTFNVRVAKQDFHGGGGGEWVDKCNIPIDRDFMELLDQGDLPVLSIGDGQVLIFHSYVEKTMWVLNVKLNQWWKVGNRNLKENLEFRFMGFHVNNKPVPLDSIGAFFLTLNKRKYSRREYIWPSIG